MGNKWKAMKKSLPSKPKFNTWSDADKLSVLGLLLMMPIPLGSIMILLTVAKLIFNIVPPAWLIFPTLILSMLIGSWLLLASLKVEEE